VTKPVTEGTKLVGDEESLTFRLRRERGKRKIGGQRTEDRGGDYEDDDGGGTEGGGRIAEAMPCLIEVDK